MVRLANFASVLALLGVLVLSGPARGDPVDWASSGGDLFVTAGVPEASPRTQDVPQALAPIETQRRSKPVSLARPKTANYGAVRLLPARQPLDAMISQIATETGLDPKLLHALVIIESAYNARAISPVGAQGLTQLMPATARELGVSNAYDTEQNLRAGARYLALQIGRFNDIRLALAAYNSGPNRVARLGRVPDIQETQIYVRDGIDCYLALTAGRGITNRSQCRTSKGS